MTDQGTEMDSISQSNCLSLVDCAAEEEILELPKKVIESEMKVLASDTNMESPSACDIIMETKSSPSLAVVPFIPMTTTNQPNKTIDHNSMVMVVVAVDKSESQVETQLPEQSCELDQFNCGTREQINVDENLSMSSVSLQSADNDEPNTNYNLTEKTMEDFRNLSVEQHKEDIVLEYLNCVELSVSDDNSPTNNNNNNNDNNVIIIDDSMLNNSDSEEDDKLKPLIMDNHPSVEHPDYFTYQDSVGSSKLSQHLEVYDNNKEFCSSNGSDLSTQYDHQDLVNLSEHSDDFKNTDLESSFVGHHHQLQRLPLTTTPTSEFSEIKEIDTLTTVEIPDDKLCEDIVEQVEFYFSDESILKDAFLLKHVRRNKEGFVSLKLVSSFKRVRQFTKDWRVVGHAIRRKCRNIELNDIGTKIRRMEPLPTFDETMSSRTIVASDLPFERLCIEKITDIFSKFGEIALIRILRPGMTIPVDVRQFMNKYPEMQQKECALVEYLDSQSARAAKHTDGNYQVFDMVAPKKKTGKKSAPTVTKFIENYKYIDNNYEKSRGGGGGMDIKAASRNPMDFRHNKLIRNGSDYYVKPEENHSFVYQPPHMPFRRHSTNMQDNLAPHIHHMQNYNNIMNDNMNNSNNNLHFQHYSSPRRISNCSINSNTDNNMMTRKYSGCSDGYSSCSEMSRRTSNCSTDQNQHQQIRRSSNCSVDFCPCSRKLSQCSDTYRNNNTQCPEHANNFRRFSSNNNAYQQQQQQQQGYDRSFSNPNARRISMDSNYERKLSVNSGQGHFYDKFSNGFDPNRKLSNTDQYHNGRRISTDSGYDRKMSFGSDYSSSPRSRTGSFVNSCPHNKVEAVVRTPIGPDGSKGFSSRIRKVGQVTVQPVN